MDAADALGLGPIHLRVRDPGAMTRFYEGVLGLSVRSLGATDEKLLGVYPPDGALPAPSLQAHPLLVLHPDPAAPPRRPGSPGLFHVALLLPDVRGLGRTLNRLAQAGVPLQGAAHHGVSQALYLADPEGNGLELYADEPEASWQWNGDEVAMVTLPLDLENLMSTAGGESATLPPGVRVGHLHLQAPSLEPALTFFQGQLGLAVTARGYPGAVFLSRGRYHHHIAVNRWGQSGEPGNPAAAGIMGYELNLPPLGSGGDGKGASTVPALGELVDPWGWKVRIRLAEPPVP